MQGPTKISVVAPARRLRRMAGARYLLLAIERCAHSPPSGGLRPAAKEMRSPVSLGFRIRHGRDRTPNWEGRTRPVARNEPPPRIGRHRDPRKIRGVEGLPVTGPRCGRGRPSRGAVASGWPPHTCGACRGSPPASFRHSGPSTAPEREPDARSRRFDDRPVLSVEGLARRFGGRDVVDGFDLEFQRANVSRFAGERVGKDRPSFGASPARSADTRSHHRAQPSGGILPCSAVDGRLALTGALLLPQVVGATQPALLRRCSRHTPR